MDFGLFGGFVSYEKTAMIFSTCLLGISVHASVVHTPRDGLSGPGSLQLQVLLASETSTSMATVLHVNIGIAGLTDFGLVVLK